MSPDSKRADAARNAERLLAAARELIAESGNDLALDQVARRAGVGNATLYRHFPTRADLLAAVYADEVAALCRRAAELDLFAWLDEFVVHVATKRALAQAAAGRGSLFDAWHAAIKAAADDLVERARPALRPGVTTADVLALATGVALATDETHARRLVALLRTGLTTSLAESGDPGAGLAGG